MRWKFIILLVQMLLFGGVIDGFSQDQSLADSLIVKLNSEKSAPDSLRFYWLSKISFNHNNPDSALYYAQLLASESTEPKNLYQAKYNEGSARRLLGDLDGSLDAYFEALNHAITGKFQKDESKCYVAIGDVYSVSGAHANSVEYYTKAINILRELKDSVTLATALFNAGDELLNQDSLDAAIEHCIESASIFKVLNYPSGIAYNLGNIGIINALKGQDAFALSNINEAISILEKQQDYYAISVYLSYMSDIYLDQDELENALLYAKRSLALATNYGLKDQISEANKQLSILYENENNDAKALEHYKEYIRFRDSLNNLESVQKMADLRLEFEMSQKQAEVDLLNQQKENQRITVISTIIIAALLAMLAFGLYRRNRFNRKTKQIIEEEKNKSENLLLNILPIDTANELKRNGKVQAQKHDSVTIMFTDFKGFTTYAEKLPPEELVKMIDFYFSKFDEIIGRYGLEKIKTIGDSYMCACGLPMANSAHAKKTVEAALAIKNFVQKTKTSGDNTLANFDIRIGINSGSVIAGVVGSKKFAYDIWGDAVNIASRMESHSEPGQINISEHTYQLIKDGFECTYRGEVMVKNRGKLKMYFIESP